VTAHPPEAERGAHCWDITHRDDDQLSGVNHFFNLKPEQERIIQEEIRSSLGSSDETLDHAVAAVREKEHKSKITTLQRISVSSACTPKGFQAC
jgi:hypothetical protein